MNKLSLIVIQFIKIVYEKFLDKLQDIKQKVYNHKQQLLIVIRKIVLIITWIVGFLYVLVFPPNLITGILSAWVYVVITLIIGVWITELDNFRIQITYWLTETWKEAKKEIEEEK